MRSTEYVAREAGVNKMYQVCGQVSTPLTSLTTLFKSPLNWDHYATCTAIKEVLPHIC
jgi:hypothetical protein